MSNLHAVHEVLENVPEKGVWFTIIAWRKFWALWKIYSHNPFLINYLKIKKCVGILCRRVLGPTQLIVLWMC